MIPDDRTPIITLKVGDRAQLVHLPTRIGPEIVFPATVRKVLQDGYLIDTDHQQGIKVKLKDLRTEKI